ncbi:MAG: TFIIB-type zinc finger domain-containing protein [Firmicutes bacterium]|nr:TFIIB-type zinc finger domain-containing protein [Bacillota bacterium]
MKALKCDLCGSVDIIKKDGFFQCEHCGCKYDIEEVKKMLIEGTVDVSGSTVKIDNSQELNNLYTLARRAITNYDIAEIKKFYEQILIKNPYSWEAMFCLDVLKIQLPANCTFNYYDYYKSFYEHIISAMSTIGTTSEQAEAVKQLYNISGFMIYHLNSLMKTYRKSLLNKHTTGDIVKKLAKAMDDLPNTKSLMAYHIGSYALSILGDNNDIRNAALEVWKDGLSLCESIESKNNTNFLTADLFGSKTQNQKRIELLKYKINQYSEPINGTSQEKTQQIPELLKPKKKSIFSKLETLGQSNK